MHFQLKSRAWGCLFLSSTLVVMLLVSPGTTLRGPLKRRLYLHKPINRSIVEHPQCACPCVRCFHIHLTLLFAQFSKPHFIISFLEDEVTSTQAKYMTCPGPCDLEVTELVLSSDLWVSSSTFCSLHGFWKLIWGQKECQEASDGEEGAVWERCPTGR